MRGGEIKLQSISEKEKGYLFGLFEGDGYKFYDKKSRHYLVEFYLNSIRDKKTINFLTIILKKINLNPNLYLDKRFNCMRIRVYSKRLFEIIHKNILFNDHSTDFLIGYISGFIDSEGHVDSLKHTISIMNTNNQIMKQCQSFLKSLGINSSLALRKPSSRDKLPSYRMYVSVNFKSIPHLSLKAGMLG